MKNRQKLNLLYLMLIHAFVRPPPPLLRVHHSCTQCGTRGPLVVLDTLYGSCPSPKMNDDEPPHPSKTTQSRCRGSGHKHNGIMALSFRMSFKIDNNNREIVPSWQHISITIFFLLPRKEELWVEEDCEKKSGGNSNAVVIVLRK